MSVHCLQDVLWIESKFVPWHIWSKRGRREKEREDKPPDEVGVKVVLDKKRRREKERNFPPILSHSFTSNYWNCISSCTHQIVEVDWWDREWNKVVFFTTLPFDKSGWECLLQFVGKKRTKEERKKEKKKELKGGKKGCRDEDGDVFSLEWRKKKMNKNPPATPPVSQVKWTHVFRRWEREGIGLRTQLISVISRLFKLLLFMHP